MVGSSRCGHVFRSVAFFVARETGNTRNEQRWCRQFPCTVSPSCGAFAAAVPAARCGPGCGRYRSRHNASASSGAEARVEHDLWYIDNWSLGLDLKIMALTVSRLWFDRNAYRIKAGARCGISSARDQKNSDAATRARESGRCKFCKETLRANPQRLSCREICLAPPAGLEPATQ